MTTLHFSKMRNIFLGILFLTIVSVFSQPIGFPPFQSVANVDLRSLANLAALRHAQQQTAQLSAAQSVQNQMSAQNSLQQFQNQQLNAGDTKQAASVTIIHRKGLNNQRYLSSANAENLSQASARGQSSKGSSFGRDSSQFGSGKL